MKLETPLQVAAFLDTRPGHIKQTLGVLDALKEFTEIRVHQVPVPHLGVTGEVMNWLKYALVPGSSHFANLSDCDFFIGTGSRTHIPMLNCKKKYGIPVLTCMAPAPIIRGRFDLCFVPQHDRLPPDKNIFVTLGPPNRSRLTDCQDPQQGLILIGGRDDKSHRWDTGSVINQISSLVSREHCIQWLVTTSPRTPDETAASLKALAADFGNAQFVPFSDTGPGWIEKEYAANQTVWVTADSMSMVFEALSAGCRVGLLPVAWKSQHNKFQLCEDDLNKKGYTVSFSEWEKGKASWALSRPLNEARRCAKEILRRWWPDRLQ